MQIKEAIALLKPFKRDIVIILILAVVVSVISAVTPFISEKMIDDGLLKRNVSFVVIMALAIITLQGIGKGVEFLQQKREIQISDALGEDLKTKAFEHGLKLKSAIFRENSFIKVMSDALYDISNVMLVADNSFLTVLAVICRFLGAIIGLFILDWRLALFILALLPLKFFIHTKMKKRIEALSETALIENRTYNTWYSNVVQGVIDCKLWGLESRMIEQFKNHIVRINLATKRVRLLNEGNSNVSQFISISVTYVLYAIGAVFITRNNLTVGGLVAFITFTTYALMPIDILLDLGIILKRISPSVESLKKFYGLEEEMYLKGKPFCNPIEVIEFNNVSVEYDGNIILSEINLTVKKGEKIAIIGENGSGKTSLVNLLLRFIDPSEGEIKINGTPISEYDVTSYRKMFSVVMQDFHLFQGSLKENILLGEQKELHVNKRDDLRFCTEIINRASNGYDTEIGVEGLKLSGGEQQKLALLRALNRYADVLILDEPTSNYDAESKKLFYTFLSNEHTYAFTFVVTHDLEELNSASQVWRIENGKVVTVQFAGDDNY